MNQEMEFKNIVAQYSKVKPEEMTGEMRFREDLGFTSLDFMSFLGELEDTFDIELEEILLLLLRQEQGFLHGLFPADNPWVQGVLYKFHGLLLDVVEGAFLQVANHVWRDAVEPGNLIELELPRFQELCFFRRDADLLVLHAFFQQSYFVGIAGPPVDGIPRIPDFGRVLQNAWMLQYPAGTGPVGKELGAVFLGGDSHADSVFCHSDRRITDKAVKAEPRNVENFVIAQ